MPKIDGKGFSSSRIGNENLDADQRSALDVRSHVLVSGLDSSKHQNMHVSQ